MVGRWLGSDRAPIISIMSSWAVRDALVRVGDLPLRNDLRAWICRVSTSLLQRASVLRGPHACTAQSPKKNRVLCPNVCECSLMPRPGSADPGHSRIRVISPRLTDRFGRYRPLRTPSEVEGAFWIGSGMAPHRCGLGDRVRGRPCVVETQPTRRALAVSQGPWRRVGRSAR